jgi:hypothetical protein
VLPYWCRTVLRVIRSPYHTATVWSMYVLRLQLKEIQDGSLLHLRDLSPTRLPKEEIYVHDIREWKGVCTTYLSPF